MAHDHQRGLARDRLRRRRALGARRPGTPLTTERTARVFVYGTLELPELVERLVGRHFPAEPATLEGFARGMLRGRSYPGIAPAAGASTAGTLYSGVDPGSLAALDRFEGELYERREVPVRTASGEVRAFAWVLREEHRGALTARPWDRERFAARHLRDWLASGSVRDVSVVTHRGGCHCGAVRFEVEAPAELELYDCNCSICSKSGYLHLIVPRERFRLLRGEPELASYRFGTGVANHLFCCSCGIKSFYVPRSDPDGISVNARCLDEGTVTGTRIEPFDGRDWERAMGAQGG